MVDQIPERVVALTKDYTELVHYGGRSDEAETLLCAIERDWAAETPRLLTLLVRSLEMLEYMEDRGFSSQRLLRSDIEAALREFPVPKLG